MHVDHYIAECVVVGGARRASRMSTKFWKDSGAFDFCSIKNDAGLWSSNNSIAVDEEFWQLVSQPLTGGAGHFELRAHEIMQFAVKQAYDNRTGEPGFINVDQLRFVKHELPNVEKDPLNTMLRMQYNRKKYQAIVNPCGEISFSMLGAVCIIGDAVPYHAETIDEAEDAIRCMTRALIRLNTMENLAFPEEVKRTNRIGVGLTGIHEFAWDEFGYGFKDLINEEKSQDFWDTIKRLSLAVRDEANLYSARLGISAPHTCVTMKPSGCTTLDTTVICEDGTRTMADIFAEHGYESIVQGDMTNAEIGWLKVNPEAKFMVRDENDDLQRITGLYINGVMPTFEIEFEDGNSYRFTGDHKLKTLNGWKRVDELTESDEIVSYPVSDDV